MLSLALYTEYQYAEYKINFSELRFLDISS